MKYIIALLAAVLVTVSSIKAQDAEMLWRDMTVDCFPAVNPKQKMEIRDFAEAFALAHSEFTLACEIGEALDSKKVRPDINFVLDKANGYLFLSYRESSFIQEAEMCVWNLPDGKQRFCVKIEDVNEEEYPVFLIAFYRYDRKEEGFCIENVEGRTEMMDNLDLWHGNENLFLPRKGKDIKWGRNNSDEPIGWYRYQGTDGFKLERVEVAEE